MYRKYFKRLFDFTVALLLVVVLSPVILFVTVLLMLANNGKPFFFQDRPGYREKRIRIVKFKSMNDKRDEEGNLLPDNVRLTTVGKFVRSTSLDELPQLYNVLKGDMSLVGPRPERQFFIDQIVDTAPEYLQLQKVKPGITSWGQIKFGYAENVDQMVERLKFDILYIENMSLAMDLKIIFYTVLIILRGSGK